MRRPYYRACPDHKEELEDRTVSMKGHEVLWCAHGKHRCKSWLVLDGDGETLAVGFMNEAPRIESPDLLGVDLNFGPPPPPEVFCARGHFEWVLDSDDRYRCRICRRDKMLARRQQRVEETAPPRRRPTAKERRQYALDLLRATEERKALNKKLRKEQRCLILKTR